MLRKEADLAANRAQIFTQQHTAKRHEEVPTGLDFSIRESLHLRAADRALLLVLSGARAKRRDHAVNRA